MFLLSLGGMQTTKLDLVSSAVRYGDTKLGSGSVGGGLGWYLVSARGVMVGIYIYFYRTRVRSLTMLVTHSLTD